MKFLIFTFLLLNSFSSYANFFEKKLYIYECPKNKYATCNDGCKKSDLQVSFLLNKKENTVLLKSYFKGNTNSTIFDIDATASGNTIVAYEHAGINGVE